jgi:hypothetical protein
VCCSSCENMTEYRKVVPYFTVRHSIPFLPFPPPPYPLTAFPSFVSFRAQLAYGKDNGLPAAPSCSGDG